MGNDITFGRLIFRPIAMLVVMAAGLLLVVLGVVMYPALMLHDSTTSGREGIHLAASRGDAKSVSAILQKAPGKLNAQGRLGTPLYEAAKDGHVDVVRLLLQKGAAINLPGGFSGRSPLHGAADYGHTQITELLLLQGADPNITDDNGVAPLHWAARNGHLDVVKILVGSGASPKLRDNDGDTPLDWAMRQDRNKVVQYLEDDAIKG